MAKWASMKVINNQKAGFTLLEMCLTLTLICGALVLGSHYQPQQFAGWAERMTINQFKENWDSSLNYSLTNHKSVTVSFHTQGNYVSFRSPPNTNPWYRFVYLPSTLRMRLKDSDLPATTISDGKIKKPQTIYFDNGKKTITLTTQMYWGHLNER